jgi:hypothetical protein
VQALTALGEAMMERVRVEQHSGGGLAWLVGWLFTIGSLQLSFWQGAIALLIWPYYLGAALRPILFR